MPECRLWVYNAVIFSGGSSNLWKPLGLVAYQNSDFCFFWDTLVHMVSSLTHLLLLLLWHNKIFVTSGRRKIVHLSFRTCITKVFGRKGVLNIRNSTHVVSCWITKIRNLKLTIQFVVFNFSLSCPSSPIMASLDWSLCTSQEALFP